MSKGLFEKRIFFAVCVVSVLPEISTAQVSDSSSLQEVSPVLESLFEGRSEKEISDIQEELEYLHQHPVNISSASLDDLGNIPLLSSAAAEKILALRDSSAHFSPADLSAISEIDLSTLEIILPCLSFENENVDAITKRNEGNDTAGDSWFSYAEILSRSRVVHDMQQRKGFADGNYLGSPFKKYQRIEINAERVAGRIVLEQDAGERLSDGFSSFSLGVQINDVLKRIVIGNYSVKSGEGLGVSSYGSTSKLQGIFSGSHRTSIVPYASTDEVHYFRGIATTLNFFPLAVNLLYSNKSVAATLDSNGTVSNFYTAGLFRTETEISKEDAVRERALGVQMNFQFGNYGYLGVLAFRTEYDKPLTIGGQSLSVYSVNGSLNLENVSLYGEAAGNALPLNSSIAGLRVQMSKKMLLHFSVRSYSPAYSSAFAFPFGERNAADGGEKGIYAGIELHPMSSVSLIGYYDEFTLSSQHEFYNRGNEYFFNAMAHAGKKLEITFQYKEKVKTQNASLEERLQRTLRFDGTYRFQKRITFRQRFEINEVNYSISKNREQGALAFSEIRFEHSSLPVQLSGRIIMFETDSYDSRVYEFESDVRGVFSNPPLYGSGMRWYCLAKYAIGTVVQVSLKYSETIKSGVSSVGSGEDKIQGPLDNRATLQLDLVL
jgi:hypothetical protein